MMGFLIKAGIVPLRKQVSVIWHECIDIFGLRGMRLYYFAAIIGVVLFALESAVALVIQLVLYSLGMSADLGALPFGISPSLSAGALCALFLLVGLIRLVVQAVSNQTAIAAQESVTTRLRSMTLHHMMFNPKGLWPSGTQIHFHFTEAFPKTGAFAMNLSQFIPLVIQATGIAILLLFVSPNLAIIGFSGLFIASVPINNLNKALKKHAHGAPGAQKALLHGIDRVTRNWIMVSAFNTKTIEYRHLDAHVRQYARSFLRIKFLSTVAATIPQCLGVIVLATLIYLEKSSIGIGGAAFLSFLYLFLRFTTTIGQIVSGIGNITHTAPALRLTHQFIKTIRKESPNSLDECEASRLSDSPDTTFIVPHAAQVEPPAISIQSVSFSYDKHRKVFDELTLQIEKGSQIGILGRSGTGKSTLLALVLGIQRPTAGAVLIDNESPKDYFEKTHARVGYVGPDPFLIQGTIRENLLYGLPFHATDAMINSALASAAFDRDVGNLKLGLEHQISENGEGLSAGQKQRLSIARSLLRKPCILVFDEATSNLDRTTEKEIRDTILSLKGIATTLVVTHRPELVAGMDAIITLNQENQNNYQHAEI